MEPKIWEQEGRSGISKLYGGSRTHGQFRRVAIENVRVGLRTTFGDVVEMRKKGVKLPDTPEFGVVANGSKVFARMPLLH